MEETKIYKTGFQKDMKFLDPQMPIYSKTLKFLRIMIKFMFLSEIWLAKVHFKNFDFPLEKHLFYQLHTKGLIEEKLVDFIEILVLVKL